MPKLNETQQYLVNEQYEDRIGPCIKQILDLAKTEKSKSVCVYLILHAVGRLLNKSQYEDLLTTYLGNEKKQAWLKTRLTSLNNLYQPNNDNHLFIKHIIDKRFYSDTLNISLAKWQTSCKELITNEYLSKIHEEIKTSDPSIYTNVLGLINFENKARTEKEEPKFTLHSN